MLDGERDGAAAPRRAPGSSCSQFVFWGGAGRFLMNNAGYNPPGAPAEGA